MTTAEPRTDARYVAGLPMYDWPEVGSDIDRLWDHIGGALSRRGLGAPASLERLDDLVSLWADPSMLLGQVCSLNPVRDGLGETDVVGTIVYQPPVGLPQPEPGSYYSVIVCRRDDPRRPQDGVGDGKASREIVRFRNARVAANGTDSQSGYWSLGHFVRDHLVDGPLFGEVEFTGAHRDSVRAVAAGDVDLAAIDVHSWRLACKHEADAAERLAVIGTTDPTPGVVCVVSWELRHHRAIIDAALHEGVAEFVERGHASNVHVAGYRSRRMEEFQVVADQVEEAGRHPWHT